MVPSSVEILVLPVPHGPKIFLRRRSAALRRSAPSARRTALVSRPHISHLRARTARRTHPERAARTESGRAPPSGPERCNRTIAAPDGDLRPLLPRRCTPRLGCRNAVRRRTSTTVLTKQTKSSVPDCGSQLKGKLSVLRPSRAWVTCVGHGVERCTMRGTTPMDAELAGGGRKKEDALRRIFRHETQRRNMVHT